MGLRSNLMALAGNVEWTGAVSIWRHLQNSMLHTLSEMIEHTLVEVGA